MWRDDFRETERSDTDSEDRSKEGINSKTPGEKGVIRSKAGDLKNTRNQKFDKKPGPFLFWGGNFGNRSRRAGA